jgi:Tol biopolymer transport system component
MKDRFLKITILIFSFIIYSCNHSTDPNSNEFSQGILVYISNINGNYDLYSMRLQNKNIVPLTDSPEEKNKPHFFPDGVRILYSTSFTDGGKIFSINIDGTNNFLLADSCEYNPLEDISPNGQLIVYQKELPIPNSTFSLNTIVLMNSDGTNKNIISPNPGGQPRFSHDGSLICYTNYGRSEPNKIMIYNIVDQTTDSISIPGLGSYEAILNPEFSPSGNKILFCTNIDSSHALYTIQIDGTNLKRISPYNVFTQDFEYSPDGSHIILAKGSNIYRISENGANLHLLSDEGHNELTPAYSPDGSKIVYSSDPNNNREYDIIIMDSDGKNKINLTNTEFIEWVPIIWF